MDIHASRQTRTCGINKLKRRYGVVDVGKIGIGRGEADIDGGACVCGGSGDGIHSRPSAPSVAARIAAAAAAPPPAATSAATSATSARARRIGSASRLGSPRLSGGNVSPASVLALTGTCGAGR